MKKENLLLFINLISLVGGLICLLLGFSVPAIIFLLILSSMVPISLLVTPQKINTNQTFLTLQEEKDDLQKRYHECMAQLDTCRHDLTECKKNSLISFSTEREQEQYDLLGFLQDLLYHSLPKAESGKTNWELACEKEHIPVTVNSHCLRVILSNVLDNAAKYLLSAGSSYGKINLTVSQVDEHILVIIKDNGPGCEETDITRLFDLNYQGSNKISGTGLGLAQAKAAAAAGNIQIWCKTTGQKGFAVYLQFLEKI